MTDERSPFDDLIETALARRSAAARPGSGSLVDVRARVQRRARRRTIAAACGVAVLGMAAVSTVISRSGGPHDQVVGGTDGVIAATAGRSGVAVTDDLGGSSDSVLAAPSGDPGVTWLCWTSDPGDPVAPWSTSGATTGTGLAGVPEGWFEHCDTVPVPTGSTDQTCDPARCGPRTTPAALPLAGLDIVVADGAGAEGAASWVGALLDRAGAESSRTTTALAPVTDSFVYPIGAAGEAASSVVWQLAAMGIPSSLGPSIAPETAAGLIGPIDLTGVDVLVVLGTAGVDPGSTSTTTTSVDPGTACSPYVVQTGDDVATIAARFAVTVEDLVTANAWPDGPAVVLLPGDVVTVPPGAICDPQPPTTDVDTTDTTIEPGTTEVPPDSTVPVSDPPDAPGAPSGAEAGEDG